MFPELGLVVHGAGRRLHLQHPIIRTLTTGMKIHIYLVADPGSRYGWLATSADQA
jgi:hypothetical protein